MDSGQIDRLRLQSGDEDVSGLGLWRGALRQCALADHAERLFGLDHRGLLKEGYFADVVVFDPKTIADKATYDNPHQYAIGMTQVFVNGVQVLKDGESTGANAGRALWGPGKIR